MTFSGQGVQQFIARHTPEPIRQFVRERRWARDVDASMRELLALGPGVVPPPALLRRIREAWGNEGFAARPEYVNEVARLAAVAEGAILECGTGLTTLVLAAVAGRRNVGVYSLEHDAAWAARVDERLAAVGLKRSVLLAPLVNYDGYGWYQPPAAISQLKFRLVVCDGPPGDTPGGRYGLLPRMKKQLVPGAIILLDDALRESEQLVLRRWLTEGCGILEPRSAAPTYALVTYQ